MRLPDSPGFGGRNQSLALALALALSDVSFSWSAVVGGTDGTDGPTHAAGGLVHHGLDLAGAEKALKEADAGTWLEEHGVLFVTGPTGTNVMDLIVVLKESDAE